MTNQEAIDKMEFCKRAYQRMIDENSQEGVFVGKGFEGKWKADTPLYKVYEDMRDACDMAIKALEQVSCENAISRQATIEAFQMFRGYESNRTNAEWVDRIETVVKKLPPINPQPKTGHWVEGQSDNPNIHNILCSRCIEGYPSKGHANSQYTREKFQWCPKCGAKMVEPQESEEE